MRAPFAFIRSSAAASHDPATDTLSVWLRSSELTGTGLTLDWPGKASAGTSATNGFATDATGDVSQPSTSLDSNASVLWSGAAPRLVSSALTRTTILGGGDSVGASYTVAYVLQPVSASAQFVDGGGLYTTTNAEIFGDRSGGWLRHIVSSDAGTCKVGAYHYEDGLGYGGTTPMTWPGGFGTWGLLWMVYTLSSTLKIRIKTVGNVAAETTHAIPVPLGSAASDIAAEIGEPTLIHGMRMVEMMAFPGQALSAGQISTREQGYFKARYPTLGL